MGNERIRLIAVIVLLVATSVGVHAASRYRRQIEQAPDWQVVPYGFEGWTGSDGKFDPVYGTDPADTSLLRIYGQAHQPPVILYVGFFGDLTTILDVHTPELCYPAQGWKILREETTPVGVFRGKSIGAKQILVDKVGDKRLVVWWYNAGGHPSGTRIRHIYSMLTISMITGRTDGSIVRLETPVREDGEAAAVKRINDFEKDMLPSLDRALPL